MTKQDLNSRQRQWIELLVDNDVSILYHLSKANAVVDVLSQKIVSMGSQVHLTIDEGPLALDIQSLANTLLQLDVSDLNGVLALIGA